MNWLYVTAIGTYLLGMATGYINRLFSLLYLTIRIPPESVFQVYQELSHKARWKFVLNDSLESANEYNLPATEQAIMYVDGKWIYSDISEKYMTAGVKGKETLYNISYLRFNRRSLIKFLKETCEKKPVRDTIKVFSTYWGNFREVAALRKKNVIWPVLSNKIQEPILKIVEEFEEGKRNKAGFLFYGPPGNGKTSIVRALAARYNYDIYIPIIKPQDTNEDIIHIFQNIPKKDKAMILFEDFDNLFNGRWPVKGEETRYSFDVILNILDGLYADLSNKIICITTNQIGSIDDAIKNRPNRIDLSIEVENPSFDERIILTNGNRPLAKLTEGCSAAMVRELYYRNLPLDKVTEAIENIKEEERRAMANKPAALVQQEHKRKNVYVYLTPAKQAKKTYSAKR